jgi:hypothetical protein
MTLEFNVTTGPQHPTPGTLDTLRFMLRDAVISWSDEQFNFCIPAHLRAECREEYVVKYLQSPVAHADVSLLHIYHAVHPNAPRIYVISVHKGFTVAGEGADNGAEDEDCMMMFSSASPPHHLCSLHVVGDEAPTAKTRCIVLYHNLAMSVRHFEAVGWKKGSRGPSPLKTIFTFDDPIICSLERWQQKRPVSRSQGMRPNAGSLPQVLDDSILMPSSTVWAGEGTAPVHCPQTEDILDTGAGALRRDSNRTSDFISDGSIRLSPIRFSSTDKIVEYPANGRGGDARGMLGQPSSSIPTISEQSGSQTHLDESVHERLDRVHQLRASGRNVSQLFNLLGRMQEPSESGQDSGPSGATRIQQAMEGSRPRTLSRATLPTLLSLPSREQLRGPGPLFANESPPQRGARPQAARCGMEKSLSLDLSASPPRASISVKHRPGNRVYVGPSKLLHDNLITRLMI